MTVVVVTQLRRFKRSDKLKFEILWREQAEVLGDFRFFILLTIKVSAQSRFFRKKWVEFMREL